MSKKLVAFFSAEGTTAKKAELLKEAAGADIYEIKPENPYSEADINWRNPLSRCNKEWIKKAKISLSDRDAKIEDYDVIFLAFPIWYYQAPLIIRSFFEAYDFSGKRIVLFATSGGSSFGKTAENLKKFAPSAEIVEGAMLNSITSVQELTDIVNKY